MDRVIPFIVMLTAMIFAPLLVHAQEDTSHSSHGSDDTTSTSVPEGQNASVIPNSGGIVAPAASIPNSPRVDEPIPEITDTGNKPPYDPSTSHR